MKFTCNALTIGSLSLLLFVAIGRASAQDSPAPTPPPPDGSSLAAALDAPPDDGSTPLAWGGYVTAAYERFDFFRNAQDTTPLRRARFDLERVVFEARKDFDRNFGFAVELEVEHAGTGASVEFEGDEFGEFEQEIEHGGEVEIEQAYLRLGGNPKAALKLGHLLVPFGMVNTHHAPTDYFTIRRSLAETSLIPSVWHETGAEVYGRLGQFGYSVELVGGLDSTGFSSNEWIAGGNLRRLEFAFADDLAFVGRVDYYGLPHALIGAAAYRGDTAGNRPIPNLATNAALTLLEGHARYDRGPLAIRTSYLWGRLDNADEVTRANLTAFNPGALGISRTPVGSTAYGFYAEAGWNVMSFWKAATKRLDVFGRYDAYDTMHTVEGTVLDNPRYQVKAYTFGLNFRPRDFAVLKAEYSHRTNEGDIAPTTNVAGFGLGFSY